MSSKVVKLEIGTVYQKTQNRQKALNKTEALIPVLKASILNKLDYLQCRTGLTSIILFHK